MKKISAILKSFVMFIYKTFPVLGGYSVKDASDLMNDPDHYNYRGNSWLKKQDDRLIKRKHR